MLKNIPPVISPELMKVLMEMGHGDEICLGDGNFPSESFGKRVVRLDGHGAQEVLEAVLKFLPLDTFVDNSVFLMQMVSNDQTKPEIWEKYRDIINKSDESKVFTDFEMIERFAFYERAKKCYAVIATGETALYANIILKKGVVV